MLPPLINISLFRAAIEQDILILTPNHRLAAQINHAWGLNVKTARQSGEHRVSSQWITGCDGAGMNSRIVCTNLCAV